MNKRVVFVTWGGGYNFGGCFQSYALLRKLQDLGYDVLHLTEIRFVTTVRDRIKQWIKRSAAYRLFVRMRRSGGIVDRKIRKWFDAYPRLSVCTKAEMRRLLRETDCFVSGSDQIWNTYHQFSPFFFLDFAQGHKRVSYASSIGTSDVNPRYAAAVKSLLDGFSHISVRERSGVRAIGGLTERKDVVQVLDPSFLLTREEWRLVGDGAELEFKLPKRYILCYVLGRNPDYATWLNRVMAQTGITDVIVLPAKYDNPDFAPSGCFVYQNAGPREFIKLLENAELVVTDSFHATAFSLNFQKPFVEFLRFSDVQAESQNSRIYDLLGDFELRHRIYRGECEVLERALEGWESEFERVQERLVKERMRCQRWLADAIEH